MSDDFTELETELKRLRPRTLSSATLARLAAASPDAKRETRGAVFVWLWPAFGAAAVAALTLLGMFRDTDPAWRSSPSTAATSDPAVRRSGLRLAPVAATNVLYGADVERTVRLSDDTAAKQVRYRYLDTVTWRDPQRGATYQWSVPRDEVMLVPVRAD